MRTKQAQTIDAVTAAAHEAAAVFAKAAAEAAKTVAIAAASANQLLNNDISYIKQDIKEIKDKLDNKYVTTEAFDPVRRVVYGLVAAVFLGVVTAVLALVLK